MDNIIFKPLAKKYYNDIKKMICDTWQFDKYVPEKYLEIFVSTVFYSYLCECNYSRIALVNNKVTGVMLAHITTGYFDFKYFMLMIFRGFKLSFHSEGRKCFEILKNISVCEKEIQKASESNNNKLLLLIVDKNMRNCGIGSALINDLQQKCKSYQLITDTLCNYTFYDMKGFQRVKTKQFVYFSGLENLAGLPVPFFILTKTQYLFSFLPSFWIAKLCLSKNMLFALPVIAVSSVWIWTLYQKFVRKLI